MRVVLVFSLYIMHVESWCWDLRECEDIMSELLAGRLVAARQVACYLMVYNFWPTVTYIKEHAQVMQQDWSVQYQGQGELLGRNPCDTNKSP